MFLTEWIRWQLRLPNCRECEVLRHQLDIANDEKRKLLNAILDFNKPSVEIKDPEKAERLPAAIGKARRPWSIIQQELESDDRKKAEELTRKRLAEVDKNNINKSTDDLEKELLDATDDNARKNTTNVNAIA